MKKHLFFVICVIVLISCREKTPVGETEFYFDNSQPINDSELTSIPSKFIGNYRIAGIKYLLFRNRRFMSKSMLHTLK